MDSVTFPVLLTVE